MNSDILQRIADGRTDLVFEYVSENRNANSTDQDGGHRQMVRLLRGCQRDSVPAHQGRIT